MRRSIWDTHTDLAFNIGRSDQWRCSHRAKFQRSQVLRSYRDDVSLLLDVCRQAIVFEEVKDLTDCLAKIRDDPEVRIVRIKNRLDADYDVMETAGYRDVAINLVIGTPEMQRLVMSHHVSEVQLILREFAELKSNEGHSRYIQFRNIRGE